jgi:hypothetical protein
MMIVNVSLLVEDVDEAPDVVFDAVMAPESEEVVEVADVEVQKTVPVTEAGDDVDDTSSVHVFVVLDELKAVVGEVGDKLVVLLLAVTGLLNVELTDELDELDGPEDGLLLGEVAGDVGEELLVLLLAVTGLLRVELAEELDELEGPEVG